MELPDALLPWRESLEFFKPTAALALGPLLQRLELAFGPFHLHGRHGDGDPDGFNGIARRGSYERLLVSEWLLAEEMPEEFMRRALTGEHAFLQLARRAPAEQQECLALVDAGPEQWGAPRIAHLAALIVLERRARAAGLTFRWGVLQDEEHQLRQAGNQAGLRQLLDLRNCLPVTEGQVSEWSARHVSPNPARQEVWLIGGAQAVSLLNGGCSGLRIEESWDPALAQLDATVLRPGSAPKRLVLPLPDEAACVRLLRDTFKTAVTTPQRATGRFAPTSNLVFSTSGNKLFSRSHEGALIAYPIPNSPLAGVGKPKLHPPRMPGTIIAAGRTRKVTVALLADFPHERLHLECLSGSHTKLPEGPVPVPDGFDWGAAQDPRLDPILGLWPENEAELYALVGKVLLQIKKDGYHPPTSHVFAGNVGSVSSSTQGMACVTREGSEWVKAVYPPLPSAPPIVRPNAGAQSCSGFGGSAASLYWGISGLEYADGSWCVEAGETIWQLSPPAGTEVFGVTGPMKYGQSPALVVLEADRRSISVLGVNWAFQLPVATAEICFAAVSSVAAHVAYATVLGEVVIFSLAHNTVLYRLDTTGKDP